MAKEHARLKLGKGSTAFVKTHLKRLPREEETWEADFRALPKPLEQPDTHYLGLAVALPTGAPLASLPVEYAPTVNDLADLLADAMRRPLTGSARRPVRIHFRGDPRWEELFPHLKELGIEATLHEELPELEVVHLDFLRQMRKGGSGPMIVYFPGPPPVAEQFQATSRWVRECGRIEVEGRAGSGLVGRAFDDGGPVFEHNSGTTLAEALAALEEGLAGWFGGRGTELRPHLPKVEKRQRRLRHDA